ncbi:MAG: biosynthetic peptidoglycan transglycosylase [Pedobacter sp.]|nr:biosynthetic peptidoglycan transglycosylase [Pedobacter sp.]MDQ8052577.1 biosynthetic peptidoglycan transglycosylase [Pedobacter sp.]
MQFPKINIPKKYLKIGAWVLGVFFVLFFIAGAVAYCKREVLLKKIMAKAISKADKDYGLQVKIGAAGFTGLSSVNMKQISLVPKDRDTLSTISDITVTVKIFPLLFGKVKLSAINLNDAKVSVVIRDTLTNLDFILKRKKKDSVSTDHKVNLSDLASNLLNEVFYKIPDDMQLKNFMVQLNDNDTASLKFFTSAATIDNGKLVSNIIVNDTAATWHINGKLNPSRKRLNVKIFADGKKVELPAYLEKKFSTKLSFDTASTEMKEADYSGDDYKISGSWSIKNLTINQKRISSADIIVPDAKIDADMLIGENYVCLDSTSTVFLKNASVHPFLKYTLSPHKIYEMKINAEEQDAQAIFDSFPHGMFESLEGIQVSGKLRYNLDFYLDTSIPDSVRFNSTLTPTNFKIVKWGKTNLQKINSEFVYTPYEYGKPMRDILIGPSNPNFTRLEDISPNFKNALLTSEDPSFFRHHGFVEESIRKSIAVNFKEKRFKRGGSTISMQLVKNVFLSRQKTLSRKVEEILIVWLIENNRLVSKQRMLEVYFNIIEMGQNVYGIGEAAHHYFGKLPSELTIGEGIFLANIVPKPKVALYKFQSDGSLKGYLYNYFQFIGNTMARRGLTVPDTAGYGFYNVRLREGLRQYLLPDSVIIDTAKIEAIEDEAIPPGGMQDKSKTLFDRLFGSKVDTTIKPAPKTDTVKTKKQLRQERRAQRRKEKESGG